MDVVVEFGDWEHECCGDAIERDQVVDVTCLLIAVPGTQPRLIETHHEMEIGRRVERIHGRVVDLEVVLADGSTRPILRVPGGRALRGFGGDDGHLEDPWTGEVVSSPREHFLVTVRVPARRLPDPSAISWT
ncbi:hypothetical protein GTR02_08640 [Kineococcus sp. R8]|uniref:hypothetical protein n=1 Tax=Kineococcus siccus TaxID=2696567 RepID=UPI00141230FB|nr:hypothetical protein [Kineococcus siccus]NAZ81885.1 hypothetical protein [Kineococcus siccus]